MADLADQQQVIDEWLDEYRNGQPLVALDHLPPAGVCSENEKQTRWRLGGEPAHHAGKGCHSVALSFRCVGES